MPPIEKPPLVSAEPGRPITAQGWNSIVDALDNLYDVVAALGSGALLVEVTADGANVPGASVVASPSGDDGLPVVAIPPFGDRKAHTVVGISDGSWQLRVRADGFDDAEATVSVPSADPVVVPLTPVGPVVPDVFGRPLQDAVGDLTRRGHGIGTVLDTFGREISRGRIPADYQNVAVIAQTPAPGGRLSTSARVNLVVGSPVTQAPIVTMPDLSGLTQAEASRVLEQLGLRLGRIQVVDS